MSAINPSIVRLVCGTLLLAAGIAAVTITGFAFIDRSSVRSLQAGAPEIGILATECLEPDARCSTSKLIKLADFLIAGDEIDQAKAHKLVRNALENDEQHAGAWALLAYLETVKSSAFTDDAADAMRNSILYCPLCDNKDLLRWRLSFTLQVWDEVPEDIRAKVFEGADLLRWWHLDYDFLEEQGNFARRRGIPFDFYRSQVNTPVRPEEIY